MLVIDMENVYIITPSPPLRTHLSTVIHVFFADAHGLTMKYMLGGVVRIHLDHGVRPPCKVYSLTHIAYQGNVGGGWCWWR